jgi:nucleoside-diphosphate-sugar epimerase
VKQYIDFYNQLLQATKASREQGDSFFMSKMLVTGSSGLIGSEVVAYFSQLAWRVHGVDNNMRADFFGPAGDTRWNQKRLEQSLNGFEHHELDIRDRRGPTRFLDTKGSRCAITSTLWM